MIALALAMSLTISEVPTVPAMNTIARPMIAWSSPDDRFRLELYRDGACMLHFHATERSDAVLCRWSQENRTLTVLSASPLSGFDRHFPPRRAAEFHVSEDRAVLQLVGDERIILHRSR